MRFDSLASSAFARGFGIMAVCGEKFHRSHVPSALRASCRVDPLIGASAMNAARRGRAVSYVARGIAPARSIKERTNAFCPIDANSLHLVLHRGNCLHGAIRISFNDLDQASATPLLCRELLEQTKGAPSIDAVLDAVQVREPMGAMFAETSGWFVNPDMRQERSLGLLLPAAIWAYTSLFDSPFSGVAALRDTNGASSVLRRLGGELIPNGRIESPSFKGGVQLMTLHSHQFSAVIEPCVDWIKAHLLCRGVVLT